MSLTARFLMLAMLIGVLAISGIWLGGTWAQAWLLPAGLLLALLWLEHTLSQRYQFSLQRELPITVELGRSFTQRYRLNVTPARAFDIELAEAMPDALHLPDWQMPMRISDQSEASATLVFERLYETVELAVLEFDALELRYLGVFGLCSWRRQLRAAARIRVVPQSLTQAERKQFTRESGDVAQRRSGHGLELISHRDYQPGDPNRSIDWKASAKNVNGDLKVRVMSQDQNLEIAILLDVGRRSKLATGAMRRLDHHVNLASRLTQAALGAGDTLHLLVYADTRIKELTNLRGAVGIKSVHQSLAKLEPVAAIGDPVVAALALLQRVPRRCLAVFMSDTESPDAMQALLRANALLRRKHLPLVVWLRDKALAELASYQGANQCKIDEPWQAPAQQLAALEILQSESDLRRQLRGLGVVVVDAEPEQMDAKVLSAYSQIRKRKAV